MEDEVFFHLTGTRSGGALGPVDGLRPALFARFADLAKLRYDYPLVLLASEADTPSVVTLSGLVDDLLRDVAPRGIAGERMRRGVLRLERDIRATQGHGEAGTLGAAWAEAADRLASRGGAPLAEDLARARKALKVDGELLLCDAALPSRFVTHVWRAVHDRKAHTMRRRIDTLALKLSDLVRADHLRSGAGRQATTLRAGVGGPHQELFDFDRMSLLLSAPSGASALSETRRRRIERTLAALRAQRFFGAEAPFPFVFDQVETALAAYRERAPAMAELVRAIAVAELEVRGSYVEAKHEQYFERFNPDSLGPEDRALFPNYLVRLAAGARDTEDRARIIEGLTSGAPLKVLFATDDAFGLGAQLATTAMGLGDAFVLQSSSSELYRVRERVRAALEYRGPALLSVFAPAARGADVPPYLAAAAATESRAFPTFSYDPAAGTGWAQRFFLHDDPQTDRAWPEHELSFADTGMRRASELVAFTLADFAVCDPQHANDFARVPRERWGERLVPIATWLDGGANGSIPFVYAVDTQAGLHRLVVDKHLALLTRRCAEAWRRLRELDDLKHERAVVQPAASEAPAAAAPVAEPTTLTEPQGAAPPSDEPYIETPRCTTCNECTGVNPRMFAYN